MVAAVAVLSAVIGWAAGQRIKSPAEIAAEQDPPPASLITVPVEERELSQNVVVRGTVRASDSTPLSVSSPTGTPIITRIFKEAGSSIDEGDVIIEVAGRPVFALQGELPVFRNLIPGLDGPDVRQLEEALVRLGYEPGDVDGDYTGSTADAVEAFYRDRGYSPPDSSDADDASLRSARSTVDGQKQVVSDAAAAVTTAGEPVPESERLQMELTIVQAEAAIDTAKVQRTESNAAAATAVSDADQAKSDAAAAATLAAQRLAQAEGGTHPDTNQPPTSTELATLQSENTAAQEASTAAVASYDAAVAAQARTTKEQDLLVKSAEANLGVAKATRDERLAPADTAKLRSQLSDARTSLAEAEADLADARARVGAQVPISELVFLSTVPRGVQNLVVEVGDVPSGPVMTVSGSETLIESGISTADRRLIEVGATAVLEDDNLGLSIDAVVTFVADSPGGPGLSDDRYAMRLEPVDELPDDAMNVNLRISIPISSSGGEVMAVPFAALSAGSDGTARVEVERSPGTTELVEVTTGLRASGFVEINVIEGSLKPGDRVVVGRDLVLPGAGSGSGSDSDSDPGSDSGPNVSTSDEGET